VSGEEKFLSTEKKARFGCLPVPWIAFLPFLTDTLALLFSGWLAYTIRTSRFFEVDPYLLNPRQYSLLLGAAIILWHILLAWNGGYRSQFLLFRIDELLLQFKTSIVLFFLLMAATFIYHNYDYSRLILLFSWMFFVLFGSLGRQVSHRIQEALFKRGYGRRKVLLVGTNEKKDLFEKRILENPSLGIDLIVPGKDRSIEDFLSSEFVDDLFFFDEKPNYEAVWKFRSLSCNRNIRIHLVPSFGNFYLRNLSGGFFDGTVMISLDTPTGRNLVFAVKRLFDILASLFFLIVFSPLMVVIALMIKWNSPGPVFFRQTRIGKNGKPFTIYKFRSMFQEVDPYATTPTERSDPRITGVGKILRSTGLDELPQLWNVFIGDMSLVGPRPEMPFIAEKYNELEKKRLIVRPGITGLWQVYARTANLPIHSHIEYDLYYVENLSISLDLMIVLDTIPTMILRTGI